MKFIVGRNNLAASIFVPYDCSNNCAFCTTKNEYKDTSKFNVNNIVNSIEKINKMSKVVDVVITGGEPLGDLKQLDKIVSTITASKNVYINTTLPMTNVVGSINYINNVSVISGINISRHITKIVPSISDELLDNIYKPIRINCVIMRNYTNDELINFINKYKDYNRVINFRADYRYAAKETLSTFDNKFINQLIDLGLEYTGTSGCSVCNTDYFKTDDGYIVCYHRGLEHSSVKLGNTVMVNDIIVKQDGSMYYDWDLKNQYIDDMIETLTDTKPDVKPKQSKPHNTRRESNTCYTRRCH